MKKIYLFVLLFFIPVTVLLAQEAPFYKDIQHFKALDKENPPPRNAILFIGSSSFTKWTDVSDYFPGYTIINRGFGGSTLKDLLYYFNDLVPVYQPKQIVIYCGENDLANDPTPADTVINRFKRLYSLIRNYNKKVPVAYVSMKPSPSRTQFLPKFIAANAAIKAFLQKEKNARYNEVYDHMLGPDGAPMPGIFLGDSLHMNAEGYHIWQKIIQPYLKK